MSKYKKIEITPRKLKEIRDDTAKQMIVLMLAYLMDEVDYSADKLIETYNALTRYVEAIDNKLISVKTVENSLAEQAELEIRWKA